ncbi:MAG: hypothetical protein KDK24_16920 [Pseudooceanicola sp.]|nr:hypothetical protein [Pseudooceanicola sp.]
MTNLTALPSPAARLSARLRQAIDLRVRGGRTIKEACAEAGLSESAFYKAIQRPAVRDHMQELQERFVTEVEAKRTAYRAEALDAARDLMKNAKSEAVRARMIEFLAGDGKAPAVSVNVDARQAPARGYEFVRPGQSVVQIVDVEAAQDD